MLGYENFVSYISYGNCNCVLLLFLSGMINTSGAVAFS